MTTTVLVARTPATPLVRVVVVVRVTVVVAGREAAGVVSPEPRALFENRSGISCWDDSCLWFVPALLRTVVPAAELGD